MPEQDPRESRGIYRGLKQKRRSYINAALNLTPSLQSRASRSKERWAQDVRHIDYGQDGWRRLAAVTVMIGK